MTIEWNLKHFNELTVTELYSILQQRTQVFVVEQQCIYQDVDNKDEQSWHLCGWVDGQLAAYCRLLPPGLSYRSSSIGRVLTALPFRRYGYGRTMMQQAIQLCQEQFGSSAITISAQLYLQQFYQSLGFVQQSEVYMEDGIPHIQMQLG